MGVVLHTEKHREKRERTIKTHYCIWATKGSRGVKEAARPLKHLI